MTEQETGLILDFLKREISPDLIMLFGSAAAGRERPDSDIDIAYLGDVVISPYARFMLAQKLADLLKREVDLIDLFQASTVMQMQILSTGRVLHCGDERRKALFEMQVYKMYAKLNEERAPILQAIKERGTIYEP
ncbi:type VII toxin-antitoxin system MntA family adenylyltransferase antitoxin [Paenibacillus herberti]|uniref:DNA polymerase subunit beta n=1 Tax=Paenibacillus herberti TaxID=1619309 RepID=A0A229NVZ6_9BACL|nr:nucleotidyltransferase domain-containing protein [Paenibacillus herberti]OXM14096.1 DNA polymerase subunit beta [Paenibacillus herberti]